MRIDGPRNSETHDRRAHYPCRLTGIFGNCNGGRECGKQETSGVAMNGACSLIVPRTARTLAPALVTDGHGHRSRAAMGRRQRRGTDRYRPKDEDGNQGKLDDSCRKL